MHPAIRISQEGPRGCGFRKKGGIYLVAPDVAAPCGRLPVPLTTCPCCGAGVKPARGWTWVDAPSLIKGSPCIDVRGCPGCPLALDARVVGRAGLLWIGERFYPTVEAFNREASLYGVSRRISTVPREFKLGEHWVLLAHRKAYPPASLFEPSRNGGDEATSGIFRVFKPTAIEVVVDGTESDEEIDALVKRGLSPVLVERVEEQAALVSGGERGQIK